MTRILWKGMVEDMNLTDARVGEEYIVKPTDDINTISGGDGGRAFETLRKNKTDVIHAGQTLYL